MNNKKEENELKVLNWIIVCIIVVVIAFITKNDSESESTDLYVEGQRNAVERIKDEAQYSYDTYVSVEQIEDLLLKQYGAYGEEIRDSIIYHPDVDRYSVSDIVDTLIEESSFY